MGKILIWSLLLIFLVSCSNQNNIETDKNVTSYFISGSFEEKTSKELGENIETEVKNEYSTDYEAEAVEHELTTETKVLDSELLETTGLNGVVYEYSLFASEHPELDFGYHDEYMNYAICDYAIAPNGNLLLLIMSDSIMEYTPDGKFVGKYSYDFTGLNLTAYMLTCDEYGNFYMVDGGSNAIIKADRNEIKNVSYVGTESGILPLTLLQSMYAIDEDYLELMGYNEKYDFCIYRVDISGEEAVLLEEPFLGQSLGGRSYAQAAMVKDENGDRTSECTLFVHYSDGTDDNFRFRSDVADDSIVYGLGIYGINDNKTILGYIREWCGDGEDFQSLDTKIKIEKGIGITEAAYNNTDDVISNRCYGGETYIMRRTDDEIRILPMRKLFNEEEWTTEHWYSSIVD